MLARLFIQNYAIIDRLDIEFSPGLNIITGETGAGKSIIAGALGLILGDRADSSVLVDKSGKCIVEGVFESETRPAVAQFLSAHQLDSGDELVIRREIGSQGKSRAFINDSPVTLAQLSDMGCLLVDLHRQYDTLQLSESDFQREVLDTLAGQQKTVEEFRSVFQTWQKKKSELENLRQQKHLFEKEADYNRFQLDELQEAGFRENELEETEAELKMLSHAEGIKNILSKIHFELSESEMPVVRQLKILLNQLQPYVSCHPGLDIIMQRLQSAQIELHDIAGEVERMGNLVKYEPGILEKLSERLSAGYRLLKKHGVKTTNDLLQVQQQLEEKLMAVFRVDDAIEQLDKECSGLFTEAMLLAEKISKGRQKQAKPLAEKINTLLAQVGMPNAAVRVEVQKKTELAGHGLDDIEFLFDANRSRQFMPLRKVASGGELNRLMLCIKSLVAQTMELPTMVFDEIDSGISGEAARQVGIILKQAAAKRQVICITHQPQIAGKADAHFFVYKEKVNGSVKTHIRKLNTEERITAIAKMLSGEKPTPAAIQNAKEMIARPTS